MFHWGLLLLSDAAATLTSDASLEAIDSQNFAANVTLRSLFQYKLLSCSLNPLEAVSSLRYFSTLYIGYC